LSVEVHYDAERNQARGVAELLAFCGESNAAVGRNEVLLLFLKRSGRFSDLELKSVDVTATIVG
jgi:hypothetical protein